MFHPLDKIVHFMTNYLVHEMEIFFSLSKIFKNIFSQKGIQYQETKI